MFHNKCCPLWWQCGLTDLNSSSKAMPPRHKACTVQVWFEEYSQVFCTLFRQADFIPVLWTSCSSSSSWILWDTVCPKVFETNSINSLSTKFLWSQCHNRYKQTSQPKEVQHPTRQMIVIFGLTWVYIYAEICLCWVMNIIVTNGLVSIYMVREGKVSALQWPWIP